ncbi:MAG TPA: efflux RND transporter permease subunit [Chitinophagaceae bacterium]|nr:efflux RND transporter permease subunit [Chitinophagaceae bacterium]
MNLLKGALRKPVTVLVAVPAIAFFAWLAIRNMRIDIFPRLGLPTIYVAQPYGGLSPEQMEGFVTSYYEYHFLYITGVKYVESRSIQGAALLKIQFQEGTDMSQAMAEVVGYVNRARAFMPPGTVPPFITRFDAGSVPVGQLVFTSSTRSLGEIQDLALFRVRPMFATLPGVSAPPPFGGNQKTVIVKVDPDKIRSYNLSPDEVVQALVRANPITPAGNIRAGDQTLIADQNTVVDNVKDLENVPLKTGAGPALFIRDIGRVEIGSDVTTSYALVNGKRSVYIPVTKRADASTWDVVQRVKAALPDMQAAVPPDIRVAYEFDQSGYVINSLRSLSFEGGLGALLSGLMVLLFLGDRRSALIVVLTIPLALLTGLTLLYLTGQTLNIMTLGGLALSIGILVDMATVTLENIHQQLERGQALPRAILDGCREVAGPLLLILFSMLAVFTPALFMSGVPRGLFGPLALSVSFSLIASFLLSLTFVPVAANALLKQKGPALTGPGSPALHPDRLASLRQRYSRWLAGSLAGGTGKAWAFLILSLVLLGVAGLRTGTALFPAVDAGQAQVRLRLPAGTRLERTEQATQTLLHLADSLTGHRIAISSAFVGTQPSSYPINNVYLWTSGPQEAVLKIKLAGGTGLAIETFKDRLRQAVTKYLPQATLSFEPGDQVEQVLNLGSNNPIEIAVVGRDLSLTRKLAEDLTGRLRRIPYLRDVQVATPLDYPGVRVRFDRVRAGQLGLTIDQVSKSTVAATSSSRFTQPNYWLDRSSGTAYQVQVEYPQYRMNSSDELGLVPVAQSSGSPVYLRDLATTQAYQSPGEYDRLNQQRFITLTANLHGQDLGRAVRDVNEAITGLGTLPKGIRILVRGQAELLGQTQSELQGGLLIALVVIGLMLAIRFQSFRIPLAALSILPAVVAGAILLLWLTGQTLNIQSYLGIIMAVGVALANAILLLTRAEHLRASRPGPASVTAAAASRLRPILMTSLAMIAGMVPLSLGLGEGGDQTAPLGIAVIGGLVASAVSTLLFLPLTYQALAGRRPFRDPSLDPEDPQSRYYSTNPS